MSLENEDGSQIRCPLKTTTIDAKSQDQKLIEEKRRLRQRKREEKEQLLASGHSIPAVNEHGFNTTFMKRDWLQVESRPQPGVKCLDGASVANTNPQHNLKAVQFSILTYNILAQCLVRRKLFPTSGEALKWKNRRCQLLAELSAHKASIMCLQEVGKDMLHPCLHDYLHANGYSYEFHSGLKKQHGILIAWRAQFELCHTSRLNYDRFTNDGFNGAEAKQASYTNNVGLICILADRLSGIKLTVATTHLFWHPKGTCERARQSNLLIESASLVDKQYGQGRIILGGDFNTEPDDPTYMAMTQRPFCLNDRGVKIMTESAKHKSFADEDEDEEDQNESCAQQNNEAILNATTAEARSNEDRLRDWRTLLIGLSQGPQLTSLYGRHLRSVSPSKAKTHGEPVCTNFANIYRGTLDYIFVLGRKAPTMSCTGLLDLPDITKLSNGLPQEGQFPSDHFCLMCEMVVRDE